MSTKIFKMVLFRIGKAILKQLSEIKFEIVMIIMI